MCCSLILINHAKSIVAERYFNIFIHFIRYLLRTALKTWGLQELAGVDGLTQIMQVSERKVVVLIVKYIDRNILIKSKQLLR